MSKFRIAALIITIVGLMSLISSAIGFSRTPESIVRLTTDPPINQILPFEAESVTPQSPVSLTLEALAPSRQLLENSKFHLQILTPPKQPFFPTDFPAVEGTKLLDIEVIAPTGKLQIQQMLPIRGKYQLLVNVTPVVAHEVETSQDVGGTFHIEPNDAPSAGKPELAWFALTKKGGKIIPLDQCNCKLTVYAEPHKAGSPPLLEPPLKAISKERYQGIPSAEIVFPQAGAYELEISGAPKAGADFQAFDLSFEVNVTPGAAAQASKTNLQTAQSTQSQPAENRWLIPAIAISSILSLGIAWTVWQRLRVKSD